MEILKIQNLSVEYYRNRQIVPAVKCASLSLEEGETLAIVGESGSGKSTLAKSIMGLIFPYEGKITSGKILYNQKDMLKNSARDWREIRGKEISIVFQDPLSSLNPVLRAGEQVFEALAVHNAGMTPAQIKASVLNVLRDVMFEDVARIYTAYPHQLSGGERQRIALAMAIINKPRILIADEPTTALDVTIQKEILDLIDKLKAEFHLTVVFVTHNLALAYERSARIAVMREGKILETGTRNDIFTDPKDKYTVDLISSVPKL
jgi:oligopeptide transport system ATP-binding protein